MSKYYHQVAQLDHDFRGIKEKVKENSTNWLNSYKLHSVDMPI